MVFILFSVQIQATRAAEVETEDYSWVNIKKTETLRTSYDPNNQLTSQTAEVLLEIINNGTSRAVFDLVDRAEKMNASTLIPLKGTPTPNLVEDLGYITLIEWNNVSVQGGATLKFEYYAQVWKDSPLRVNQTWYINNVVANLTHSEGVYFMNANVSDVVTLKLSVQSMLAPLFLNGSENQVFQPVPYIILLSFSNTLFSDIRTEPSVTSSSLVTGNWYLNWFGFLTDDKPLTLEISARIAATDAWGQVQINPITVQTSSDVSTFVDQLDSMIKELDASLNTSYSLSQSFQQIGDAIMAESDAIEIAAEGLNQLANTMIQSSYALNETVDAIMVFSKALYAISQSILAQYSVASFARDCQAKAIADLKDFAMKPSTIEFLASNPRLALEFFRSLANMKAAYEALLIVTDGYDNLPSLYQLYLYVNEVAETLGLMAENLEILAPSTSQINEAFASINVVLQNITETSNSIANLASNSSHAFSEQTEKIRQELYNLNSSLLAAEYYSRPFLGMPEARAKDQPPKFSAKIGLERLNESFWEIQDIDFEHLSDGYDELIVYNVYLPFNVIPASIFVESHSQLFENPVNFGLKYDVENKVLTSTPWLRVNSSANILVDWMGNPIRILLKVESEIDIDIQVDVAAVLRNSATDVYSRCLDTLNQPIIMTRRVEWNPLPPPPPTTEKDWKEVLLETLKRVEVQVLIFTIAALMGIILLIHLERKKKKTTPTYPS